MAIFCTPHTWYLPTRTHTAHYLQNCLAHPLHTVCECGTHYCTNTLTFVYSSAWKTLHKEKLRGQLSQLPALYLWSNHCTVCLKGRLTDVFSNVAESAWKNKHLWMSRKMRSQCNTASKQWRIFFHEFIFLHFIFCRKTSKMIMVISNIESKYEFSLFSFCAVNHLDHFCNVFAAYKT